MTLTATIGRNNETVAMNAAALLLVVLVLISFLMGAVPG